MPRASSQPTLRTLVAAAKKAISAGQLCQAKDFLDTGINPNSSAANQIKARYVRATVIFALGDYSLAQSELETCLNHLISNPQAKSDLVADCLFLWFWATQRQNYNPKNQQDFLHLVFSKFPHENLREQLTKKKAPPTPPQPPVPSPKRQGQVKVSC